MELRVFDNIKFSIYSYNRKLMVMIFFLYFFIFLFIYFACRLIIVLYGCKKDFLNVCELTDIDV